MRERMSNPGCTVAWTKPLGLPDSHSIAGSFWQYFSKVSDDSQLPLQTQITCGQATQQTRAESTCVDRLMYSSTNNGNNKHTNKISGATFDNIQQQQNPISREREKTHLSIRWCTTRTGGPGRPLVPLTNNEDNQSIIDITSMKTRPESRVHSLATPLITPSPLP